MLSSGPTVPVAVPVPVADTISDNLRTAQAVPVAVVLDETPASSQALGRQVVEQPSAALARATECDRCAGLGNLHLLDDATLDAILRLLPPRDLLAVGACSRALRIFASEEPLWRHACLEWLGTSPDAGASRSAPAVTVSYLGSWKATLLHLLGKGPGVPSEGANTCCSSMPVGHSRATICSAFLYARWYRCNADLTGFEPAMQSVERREAGSLTLEEFGQEYEVGSRPVVLQGKAVAHACRPGYSCCSQVPDTHACGAARW